MDKELIKPKVDQARLNKSKSFSYSELEVTLNDLNLGRSRVPEGLCAELFQTKVMGFKELLANNVN